MKPLPRSPNQSREVRYGLLLVCLFAGVYTVTFYLLQRRLYSGLHMEMWDLGLFNQVLHNSVHGRLLQYSIPGGSANLFYERVQLIVPTLIPLYAIVPSVDLLFFVQAFGIAIGSVAIYLTAVFLSADVIIAVCLGAAYLLYPAIQGMTISMFLYGFHPENLAPAFLLFAVYFFLRNRPGWMYLFSALAIMCGEYMSLTVAAFGVYIILAHREKRRTGIVLVGASLLWLVLAMLVIIPLFRGDVPWYIARILGTEAVAAPEAPSHLPIELVPLYTKYLLLPILFTPLLNVPSLLLALPGLALNFLSYMLGYKGYSPFSWHMANLAPFVFLSGTFGLAGLSNRLKGQGRRKTLVYAWVGSILLVSILSSFWLSPMPWSQAVDKDQYSEITPVRARILAQLHTLIGPEDSLAADIHWASQFTSRETIHLFPYGGWRDHDWVLVDSNSEFMNPWIRENIDLVRNSPDHELRLSEDGVELFHFAPRELPPIEVETPVTFSKGVRLLGYSLHPAQAEGGEDITLDLFWTALEPVDRSYTVFVHLLSSDGRTVAQSDRVPLNGSYPTDRWPTGRTMWDTHQLAVSEDVVPGEYEVVVGLYYWEDGKRAEIVEGDGDRRNSVVRLGVVTIGGNGQRSPDDS